MATLYVSVNGHICTSRSSSRREMNGEIIIEPPRFMGSVAALIRKVFLATNMGNVSFRICLQTRVRGGCIR
jgi:hypothetical protein